MTTLLAIVILTVVILYVLLVHHYFREQERICGKYPYYRLRDRVVWEILQDPEGKLDRDRIYATLNRIVHITDQIGWRFVSGAVQEVTHAILENRKAEEPSPLEVALVDLVVASARKNSLVVRLALTSWGRVMLLYPVAKACYEHFRKKGPIVDSAIARRVETVRRIRRLNTWRRAASAAA